MRKLLYYDKAKHDTLTRLIHRACDQVNHVIESFETFQTFQQITSRTQTEQLLSDPVAMFDDAILKGIDLQSKGNLRPDPAAIATFYRIDRTGYVAELGVSCPQPGKCKTYTPNSNGESVRVSFTELQTYGRYMIFNEVSHRFRIDEAAVSEAAEQFRTYADTEESVAEVERWETLCNALNDHRQRGHISGDAIRDMAKMCGFLSDGQNLSIDYYQLSLHIGKLKYERTIKN